MVTSESILLRVGLTKSVVVTTISGMKNNLAQCCSHFLLFTDNSITSGVEEKVKKVPVTDQMSSMWNYLYACDVPLCCYDVLLNK